jgi:hypothetical protein
MSFSSLLLILMILVCLSCVYISFDMPCTFCVDMPCTFCVDMPYTFCVEFSYLFICIYTGFSLLLGSKCKNPAPPTTPTCVN